MVRSVLTKLNRNTVSTDQNFVTFDTNAAIVDVTDTFKVASYPLAIESVDITNVTTLFSLNKEQGQSDARAFVSSNAGSGVSLADKTLAETSSFSGEISADGSTFAVEAIKTVNGEFVESLATDNWLDSDLSSSGYLYDKDTRSIEVLGSTTVLDNFDDGSHTGTWTGDTSDFTYDSTVTFNDSDYSLKKTTANESFKSISASLTHAYRDRVHFRIRFSDNGGGDGIDVYALSFREDDDTPAFNYTSERISFYVSSDESEERIRLSDTSNNPSTGSYEDVVYTPIPRDEWLTVYMDISSIYSTDIAAWVFDSNFNLVASLKKLRSSNSGFSDSIMSISSVTSVDVDYSGSWESTCWIDELVKADTEYKEIRWKCIEYNPDQVIKNVFFRHTNFILPEFAYLYVGGHSTPDAGEFDVDWQQVTTYIKNYEINDHALYFRIRFFNTAPVLALRSQGLDGRFLISVYY